MVVSFIILNYKSEHYLKGCIESIKKCARDFSFEIIIINNDNDRISTIKPTDEIIIINNNQNEGFSRACNQGAKIAKGKNLFFINPDTEIVAGDFGELLSHLDDESVGIIAPRLVLQSGETQPWSAGSEINLWGIIQNNLGLSRNKDADKKESISNVGWVSGAAFAIKKSLFEQVSGFDKNFFMYFEDVDLCKRISNLGKKIVLLPSMQVLHYGGQSYDNKSVQKQQYYTSQDYYIKKHFGLFQLSLLRSLRGVSLFFKK